MSDFHTAETLIPAGGEAGTAPALRERLLWPAAALLIILASGGLWFGAALALGSLFS